MTHQQTSKWMTYWLPKLVALCLFGMGFSFPLFIGSKNIFLYASCILGLLDPDIRSQIKNAFRYTWVWASIGLALLFVLGIYHAETSFARALNVCGKYLRLLLPILLIPLFSKKSYSKSFINGLAIGVTTLSLGCLLAKYQLLFPSMDAWQAYHILNPIYTSYLCATAAFVAFYKNAHECRWSAVFLFIFGLLFICVFSQQFTGLGCLSIWIAILFLSKKPLIPYVHFRMYLMGLMLATILFNPPLLERSYQKLQTLSQISLNFYSKWFSQDNNTSPAQISDERYQWLKQQFNFKNQSLKITLLGHGTGSYADVFAKTNTTYLDAPISAHNVPNPHNEFLHAYIQLGFLGLCAFCLFLIAPILDSLHLRNPHSAMIIGIVACFAFGCLSDTMLFLTVTRDFYLCFLAWALAQINLPTKQASLSKAYKVQNLIPHRKPFLFVDHIISMDANSATGELYLNPDWDFFKGHYPNNPIMPGVLLCESVFQTAACFLSTKIQSNTPQQTPLLARIQETKFKHMARPEDRLSIHVELVEAIQSFYFMKGTIRNQDNKLVLTIQFALTLVPQS